MVSSAVLRDEMGVVSHIVVAEKMDQNLVTNPERGSNQVEESGKNEAVTQLPAQKSPVRGFEELLVDLAVVIKHKIDDAKVEPPLQCDGKELTVAEERYWQG